METKDSGVLIIGISLLAVSLLMYFNPELRTFSRSSAFTHEKIQISGNSIYTCAIPLTRSIYFIYKSFKK
jgi:hypothetical protein